MWDLIVSVPDHCLSFYFGLLYESMASGKSVRKSHKYLGHMNLNNMGYKKIQVLQKWHFTNYSPEQFTCPIRVKKN